MAYLPVMTLPAHRAAREDVVASYAQQRFEFAVDPYVDILPRVGANEM